ncbi:MAG: hypothetical protein JKY67_14225 [Pseudomonadales bacterium]|nr:hypothetical protein [Pseudomonadales bacterium]
MKNNLDYFLVGNRPIIVKTVRGVPVLLLGYCSINGSFEALPHLMNDVNSLDCQKIDKAHFIDICLELRIKPPVEVGEIL